MITIRSCTPVFCAACSSALGYYLLSRIYHSGIIGISGLFLLLLIPLFALIFFRVMAAHPLYSRNSNARLAARYSLAFFAGLVIGIGADGNAVPRFDLGLPPEKIVGISGVLREDPRNISGGRVMALMKLTGVSADRGLRASARGEIAVIFPQNYSERIKEFGRGCTVFSEGDIFHGASGHLFIADSLHITQPAPRLEAFRTNVRNSLIQRFERLSRGAPWSGLSLALLLGVKDNLDSTVTALYRDSGCAHVLSLSGMNLALIASFISLLLIRPLGLKASAVTGTFLIIVYILVVGPQPGLYRAVLMYLLGVMAVLGFLKRNALSLLSMAFIIQLIALPSDGRSISFILSYLALFGILATGEALHFIFKGKIPPVLLSPLSASTGAFLMTAGMCVHYFEILRPIGIAAGLALVPLTTVFFVGSIAWLLLGFLSPVLAGLLSPVLSLLYTLMEKIVSAASSAPPLSAGGFVPVLIITLVLSALILCSASLLKKSRHSMAAFT